MASGGPRLIPMRTSDRSCRNENFSLQPITDCGVLFNMNKFILSLTVAVFAFASAAQAGDGKACDTSKTSSSCSEAAKTVSTAKSCSDSSKTVSTANKSACCATAKQAKKASPATARGAYMAQLARK